MQRGRVFSTDPDLARPTGVARCTARACVVATLGARRCGSLHVLEWSTEYVCSVSCTYGTTLADRVRGVLAAAAVSSIASVTIAPCTGGRRAPSALAFVLPPPALRCGALPSSTHCLVGAAPRVRRALCAMALRIATYATVCHPPNRASGRVGWSPSPSATPAGAAYGWSSCTRALRLRRYRPPLTPPSGRRCAVRGDCVWSAYHAGQWFGTYVDIFIDCVDGAPAPAAVSSLCCTCSQAGARRKTTPVCTIVVYSFDVAPAVTAFGPTSADPRHAA